MTSGKKNGSKAIFKKVKCFVTGICNFKRPMRGVATKEDGFVTLILKIFTNDPTKYIHANALPFVLLCLFDKGFQNKSECIAAHGFRLSFDSDVLP